MKRPPYTSFVMLAERALAGADALPLAVRADLLEAVASILKDDAAAAATSQAVFLREADRSQLKLGELLREATR